MSRVLVRYWTIRGAVSLWLLLLAASPCTAPFVTFDLLPAAPAATLDGGNAKISKDGPVTVALPLALPYTGDAHAVPLSATSAARHLLDAQHTVLRL